MFSWSNAGTFVQNISSALENFDAELEHSSEGDEGNADNETEQLQSELETYKKLLEEAQLQHVQISKQTIQLIAEKDIVITNMRKRIVESGGEPDREGEDDNQLERDMDSLLAEKKALEVALIMLQDELQSTSRERIDAKVAISQLDTTKKKYASAVKEVNALKNEMEMKEKQKNETIDNLVKEYSTLAAETEVRHEKDESEIAAVRLENEILATKLHALEHSIAEFADRAVNSGESTGGGGGGGAGANIGQLSQELKEAKTKEINLRFDLKEKSDEIVRLQATLSSALSASARPQGPLEPSGSATGLPSTADAEAEKITLKYQMEIQNLQQDVSRLQVEKKEADDAGRLFLDQAKTAQRELEELKRVAAASSLAHEASTSTSSAAAVLAERLEAELVIARSQLADAEKRLTDANGRLSSLEVDVSTAANASAPQDRARIVELEQKVAAIEQEMEKVTNGATEHESRCDSLTAQLNSVERNLKDKEEELARAAADAANSVCEISALESDRNQVQALLSAKVADAARLQAELDALQLSVAGGEQSSAALLQQMKLQHENDVLELRAESTKKDEHIAQLQSSLKEVRDAKVPFSPPNLLLLSTLMKHPLFLTSTSPLLLCTGRIGAKNGRNHHFTFDCSGHSEGRSHQTAGRTVINPSRCSHGRGHGRKGLERGRGQGIE